MKRYFENADKKKVYKLTAVAMAALLLVVGTIGFAAAKYVSNNEKEAEIHASNFHFSSNYLKVDGVPEYNVSDWGSNSVVFYLFNYEQENTALVSDCDISYKIIAPANWDVTVEGETLKDGVYTMEQGESFHRVSLTYKENDKPNPAEVTVESKAPYKKILKAKFNLTTKQGIEYTVDDMGDYAVVTISTNDYHGAVTVGWNPATHSPDNNCSLMINWRDNKSTEVINVMEYTTYTLIFVETTGGTFDSDDFKIAGA
jgi:hypothetical protein